LAWRGSLQFSNFASLSELTGIHATTPRELMRHILTHLCAIMSSRLKEIVMVMRSRCSRFHMKIEVAPIIQLWLLRLLVPLGAYRDFVGAHEFSNERLAEVIGLGDWVNSESRDYDKKQVQAELRKLHQAAEREMWNTPAPVCLHSNVTRLAELVGLSAVDCHILEFAILIQNERLLDDAADWLGNLTSLKAFYVLSVVLDIPEQEVRASLSAGGFWRTQACLR
jgi:hypothetical protein